MEWIKQANVAFQHIQTALLFTYIWSRVKVSQYYPNNLLFTVQTKLINQANSTTFFLCILPQNASITQAASLLKNACDVASKSEINLVTPALSLC